jgi:hypothetical protein
MFWPVRCYVDPEGAQFRGLPGLRQGSGKPHPYPVAAVWRAVFSGDGETAAPLSTTALS